MRKFKLIIAIILTALTIGAIIAPTASAVVYCEDCIGGGGCV